MKKLNVNFKYLISILVILILAIIPTYAHHGHLLIDCGREVYYPTQIILGKILYKDIFNIYGPFSYMFNAFLFKFFGINLNVLYLTGCICSFLISILIYLISRKFLSEFLSFAITVFTIVIGVLNLNLFNFIFPYSYAMLYGIVSFLISVLFLLKYQENSSPNIFLYTSCFFSGLCITNKYEFLPFLIVILYFIFKIKPLKIKEYYYAFLSILFVPVFCFGVLLLQGLRLEDLVLTFNTINKMAHTQTLNFFYRAQGVYFNKSTPVLLLINFLKTAIPLSILVWAYKIKQKLLSFALILCVIIIIVLSATPLSFIFLPILILILILLNFKILKENPKLLILVFSGITVSLKVFWSLATLNYGVFFLSFLLIVVFALITIRCENNYKLQNIIGAYILIISIVFGIQNLYSLRFKNQPTHTERGEIFSNAYISGASNDLIDYIDANSKKTDRIVIFPEGTFINFLIDRKSDDYYNSLTPLYLETFGEEKYIEHFKKTKPEYIIFDNWNLSKDYFFSYICQDYALSFCSYVAENYTQKKVIDKNLRYLIFKKK